MSIQSNYKELSIEELLNIELSVLSKFSVICKEHNIKYTIYYGSLLGAVRHKGFIPWDDDIDIAMHRSDYEQLENIEWCKYDLSFMSYKTHKDFPLSFGKIGDIKTKMTINNSNTIFQIGIDIFPIDQIPTNKIILRIEKSIINSLTILKYIKTSEKVYPKKYPKKILFLFIKLLSKAIKIQTLNAWINGIASQPRVSELVGCRIEPYNGREAVSRILFDKIVLLDFVDYKLPAPGNYNEILNQIYGDYMTLPPKERRITHHTFKAYTIQK